MDPYIVEEPESVDEEEYKIYEDNLYNKDSDNDEECMTATFSIPTSEDQDITQTESFLDDRKIS